MKNLNKITVGITAYDCADFLIDAINSVLNQSVSSWNGVLVLDGGSDKATKKIFESFNHPKFKKYTFQENKGAYQTRTKAINLSTTPWYLQLDSDDLLPKNAIKDVLEIINKNPNAEFIFGNCEIFTKNKSKISKPSEDVEMLCYSPLFNAASPISTQLFKSIGGYNTNLVINADWDFWISVYENEINGAYVNSVIYRRRKRLNNLGKRYVNERSRIVDEIISRHPIFFNNKTRIDKAKYYVYNQLARYNRSIGERKKAANYVRKAVRIGSNTATFNSILREENMSLLRYSIRRLGRLF